MVQENPVYHPDLDVHPTQTLPCLPVCAEIQHQSKAFRKPAETSDAGHKKTLPGSQHFIPEGNLNVRENRIHRIEEQECPAAHQKAENPSIYNIDEITWVSSGGADGD